MMMPRIPYHFTRLAAKLVVFPLRSRTPVAACLPLRVSPIMSPEELQTFWRASSPVLLSGPTLAPAPSGNPSLQALPGPLPLSPNVTGSMALPADVTPTSSTSLHFPTPSETKPGSPSVTGDIRSPTVRQAGRHNV